MPLAQALTDFKTGIAQCESLIANAHKVDASGVPVLPVIDQQQITVAAFLNMFIAWETFLESTLGDLMTGSATLSGAIPVKYVSPPSLDAARKLIIHVRDFFDYGNHAYVRKVVNTYFRDGYPYEPHFTALIEDLSDLRTMRNWAAHISSSTQTALEALAQRIFSAPRIGIDLYQLLMAVDPRLGTGETVFVGYKNKLILAAELITRG